MGLREYGGRMVETDGRATVEMRDPNDGARMRHQYRVGRTARSWVGILALVSA